MAWFAAEGTFSYDREGVELCESLSVELNVGVMSLEMRLKNLPSFDRFTVPSLLPKSLSHGLKLQGRR